MNTDKYLTAEQLGITRKEWLALTVLLQGLKEGRFGHERYSAKPVEEHDMNQPMIGFDMGIAGSTYHCHTVRCIGGWMATIMGYELDSGIQDYVFNGHSVPLTSLLFPTRAQMDRINQADAVRAIENFLTIGKPQWDAVIEPIRLSHTETTQGGVEYVRIGSPLEPVRDAQRELADMVDEPRKLEDKSK